jgi:hypothetical protein
MYSDHFKLADDLLIHLNGVINSLKDPFITSRYVGFVAVAATTVYELAVKEIFIDFCEKKHKVFGQYARSYFERLNGRIGTKDLRNTHIPRFGDKYVSRYKKQEQQAERQILRSQGVSVLSSYNNIIQWRNAFAHQGQIPSTATYSEVVSSYEAGKEIIHCLARTMVR